MPFFKKPVLYSVALHLALLASILFLYRRIPPEGLKVIPFGSSQIQVQLYTGGSSVRPPSKQPRQEPQASPTSAQKLAKNSRKRIVRLMELKMAVTTAAAPPPSAKSRTNNSNSGNDGGVTASSSSGSPDGFDVAHSIDIVQESKLYPFFHALWHNINQAVIYPPDFVKKRVAGTVSVHLAVGRDGTFTGQFVQSDSNEILLKVYVMAALTYALNIPLPKNLWADRDKLIIVTQFEFETFGPGGVPPERKPIHEKNILSFKRRAYGDPLLNEYIDRIPIIPIPGGFVIDFYRAYKMVQAFGTPDPANLTDIRIRQMKEKWQEVIRKSDK